MTACNPFSESIVHMACRRSDFATVKFLLQHGADFLITDDYGRTPLHDACWRAEPQFDIVTLLLDLQLDLLRQADVRGSIPFHYIREEHYTLWCAYLYNQMEKYWRPVLLENALISNVASSTKENVSNNKKAEASNSAKEPMSPQKKVATQESNEEKQKTVSEKTISKPKEKKEEDENQSSTGTPSSMTMSPTQEDEEEDDDATTLATASSLRPIHQQPPSTHQTTTTQQPIPTPSTIHSSTQPTSSLPPLPNITIPTTTTATESVKSTSTNSLISEEEVVAIEQLAELKCASNVTILENWIAPSANTTTPLSAATMQIDSANSAKEKRTLTQQSADSPMGGKEGEESRQTKKKRRTAANKSVATSIPATTV
jgi:hypothetical protein